MDEIESKIVHISVNMTKVKHAINETKDKEPSVENNSVINAPRYSKIFKCSKTILKNLDVTYE